MSLGTFITILSKVMTWYRLEPPVALARARRENILDAAALGRAVEEADCLRPHLLRLEVNEERAAELALAHSLRGFHAIYLAGAGARRGRLGAA